MTTTESPIKTTSASDIARIDQMIDVLQNKMIYLAGRWWDEQEYEDINDYAAHLMGQLPAGFTLTKMTKRPFGFYFTLETGAVYHYYVTSRTIGWKRVK